MGGVIEAAASALSGLDLAALGAAYLILLANMALAAILYAAARSSLVISPNAATREYGIYASVVLVILLVATVIENRLLPPGLTTLPYVGVPHLLLLLAVHLAVWYRQEPWLIALAASALAAAVVVMSALLLVADVFLAAHWLALGLACALLAFVWRKAISTKRAFLQAHSIYVPSKERPHEQAKAQKPWLGLTQWVGLVACSLGVAALNGLLDGSSLAQLPAARVLVEGSTLLGVTLTVSAVPAAVYWLVRRAWMPELTRLVWLVWLVVGFAFVYGNFLDTLGSA